MDEDEAKALIRGLQKTADDAEHQRVSMERAARRARAIAHKKTALARAPPLAEESGEGKPRSPPRIVASASAGGSQRGGLLEGLRERISTALFSTPRSNREAREEAKTFEKRVVLKVKQAKLRIVQLGLSRAWNAWVEHASQRGEVRALLKRTVAALINPRMQRGLVTWVAWHQERVQSTTLMRRAVFVLLASQTIKCFELWARATRDQRRQASGVSQLGSRRPSHRRASTAGGGCAALADWVRCQSWINWCYAG